MTCIGPVRIVFKTNKTGYEPNDHFITEACVEYTQESLTEKPFLEDFDYDDITIGQTILNACRRRADHSEEEGLSSCLSSSSMSHDRTVKPVVCQLVSSAQETNRNNSENEQIGTLLERQKEQILDDCQAEIRKNEFQADYDRSIQKVNETLRRSLGMPMPQRRTANHLGHTWHIGQRFL